MTTRDTEIRRAVELRAVQETRILQKVNHAHREAFREKFPGSIEHCLRLTVERMQAVLAKTESTVLANPSTWSGTPKDLRDLAVAIDSLYNVYLDIRNAQSLHTPPPGHE